MPEVGEGLPHGPLLEGHGEVEVVVAHAARHPLPALEKEVPPLCGRLQPRVQNVSLELPLAVHPEQHVALAKLDRAVHANRQRHVSSPLGALELVLKHVGHHQLALALALLAAEVGTAPRAELSGPRDSAVEDDLAPLLGRLEPRVELVAPEAPPGEELLVHAPVAELVGAHHLGGELRLSSLVGLRLLEGEAGGVEALPLGADGRRVRPAPRGPQPREMARAVHLHGQERLLPHGRHAQLGPNLLPLEGHRSSQATAQNAALGGVGGRVGERVGVGGHVRVGGRVGVGGGVRSARAALRLGHLPRARDPPVQQGLSVPLGLLLARDALVKGLALGAGVLLVVAAEVDHDPLLLGRVEGGQQVPLLMLLMLLRRLRLGARLQRHGLRLLGLLLATGSGALDLVAPLVEPPLELRWDLKTWHGWVAGGW
mmetsp:Transcript_39133/g.83805  ORF Transcript_39133/g.83805 Transcript_39133/m.83805 type:complete len:428 (-) Transcript_39133:223-1506(-)